jgi:predicted N-acetyltransferase YhbS
MVAISHERESDIAAREALLDRAFGPKRRRKTAERLRECRLPAEGLAFCAHDEAGRLVGTIRLWDIEAGTAGSALLLGPIAIEESMRGQGIGSMLMEHAIGEAARRGHRAVLLVGDEPYYRRFGFTRAAAGELRLPGPVDLDRFLGLELAHGSLADATGMVGASGRMLSANQLSMSRERPSSSRMKSRSSSWRAKPSRS